MCYHGEPHARDGREDVECEDVGAGGHGEEHGGGEGGEAEEVGLAEADQGDQPLLEARGEDEGCAWGENVKLQYRAQHKVVYKVDE